MLNVAARGGTHFTRHAGPFSSVHKLLLGFFSRAWYHLSTCHRRTSLEHSTLRNVHYWKRERETEMSPSRGDLLAMSCVLACNPFNTTWWWVTSCFSFLTAAQSASVTRLHQLPHCDINVTSRCGLADIVTGCQRRRPTDESCVRWAEKLPLYLRQGNLLGMLANKWIF